MAKYAVFNCEMCGTERRARIIEMIHTPTVGKTTYENLVFFELEKTRCPSSKCGSITHHVFPKDVIRIE